MKPGPVAAAFAAYLNCLDKITAAEVIRNVRANVTHNLDWQADYRSASQVSKSSTRVDSAQNRLPGKVATIQVVDRLMQL
jgi:hypothetical protein